MHSDHSLEFLRPNLSLFKHSNLEGGLSGFSIGPGIQKWLTVLASWPLCLSAMKEGPRIMNTYYTCSQRGESEIKVGQEGKNHWLTSYPTSHDRHHKRQIDASFALAALPARTLSIWSPLRLAVFNNEDLANRFLQDNTTWTCPFRCRFCRQKGGHLVNGSWVAFQPVSISAESNLRQQMKTRILK